jgi:hypothetical protein
MGLCSKAGEDPNVWKQFGPEPTWAMALCLYTVWVGRLDGEGFWVGDYWGGVRVGCPFGALARR